MGQRAVDFSVGWGLWPAATSGSSERRAPRQPARGAAFHQGWCKHPVEAALGDEGADLKLRKSKA